MPPHAFDVVIAGAGPAGSAAAITLVRAGATVALVDPGGPQDQTWGGLPGRRTAGCQPAAGGGGLRVGESLAPAIRDPLLTLGLWERFTAAGHRPAYAVRSAWGSAEPHDQDHIFNPYGNGWHVDRRAFDRMLAEGAVEAGAQPIDGTVANASREGGVWFIQAGTRSVHARHLLDATGRPARVARRLGARRIALDRLVGVVVSVPPEQTTMATEGMTLVEAAEDGWWYSARTPDERLLVAWMTDADLWLHATRRGETLATTIERAPLTRARVLTLPDAPPQLVSAASAHLQPAAGPRWLAAGDAAMATDPLSGSGVLLALRSGMQAAAAIERDAQGDAGAFEDYSALVARTFAGYAKTWQWFYAQEQRFDSVFWRRRVP